jgi:tetratricopeptide (TPR) repeat protein
VSGKLKTDRFTAWQQTAFLCLAIVIAFSMLYLFPNGIGASLFGLVFFFYHLAMSEADYLLSELYEKLGQYEKALEAVSRQIEITENRLATKSGLVRSNALRDCYLQRAYIYEKLGRLDDAERDKTVALSLDLSTKIANSQNRFMETIRSRLGRPSAVQDCYFMRAEAYERLGEIELAAKDREAALQISAHAVEARK